MRLWHQRLIPYLDSKRLTGLHLDCCLLRGGAWGKKNSMVDYIFQYEPTFLVIYHKVVMKEMETRGYNINQNWYNPIWRGKTIGIDPIFVSTSTVDELYEYMIRQDEVIFPEHDEEYYKQCVDILSERIPGFSV